VGISEIAGFTVLAAKSGGASAGLATGNAVSRLVWLAQAKTAEEWTDQPKTAETWTELAKTTETWTKVA
tara:strand:+ start:638 stop:844 length:207 start_codon:yes stop_codon:yes gene_type:complete